MTLLNSHKNNNNYFTTNYIDDINSFMINSNNNDNNDDDDFSNISLTDIVLYDGYNKVDKKKDTSMGFYYYFSYLKNILLWFKFW